MSLRGAEATKQSHGCLGIASLTLAMTQKETRHHGLTVPGFCLSWIYPTLKSVLNVLSASFVVNAVAVFLPPTIVVQ